ncbi:hypothetical protein J4221_00790 [Candidatus Pacearchaeota archaeon]|nr:hypothetical protein [Candidatus Pacearchaeota archaeon]
MDKKIILYILVGLLLLLILVMTFFPNAIYAFKDSVNSREDKCQAPPGQTEEEWREHMSHHPDLYKQCL